MKRLILDRSYFRALAPAIFVAIVFACTAPGPTFAQHSGGHAGAPGRMSAPPVSHPLAPRPVAPFHPPVINPGPRNFVVRPYGIQAPAPGFRTGYPFRPIRPRRPIVPIVPIPIFSPFGFGLFGFPFFGFGYGWGINSGFWPNCGSFATWDYACGGFPAYQYGLGYDDFSSGPSNPVPQFEVQNAPIYYYGEQNSQFVQLYLKDGTVYSVTDYWLVKDQLHFRILTDNGTKVVEQAVNFDQLDLQQTLDVNTARGFRFVLRNEPLEQYLIDHPPDKDPRENQ